MFSCIWHKTVHNINLFPFKTSEEPIVMFSFSFTVYLCLFFLTNTASIFWILIISLMNQIYIYRFLHTHSYLLISFIFSISLNLCWTLVASTLTSSLLISLFCCVYSVKSSIYFLISRNKFFISFWIFFKYTLVILYSFLPPSVYIVKLSFYFVHIVNIVFSWYGLILQYLKYLQI